MFKRSECGIEDLTRHFPLGEARAGFTIKHLYASGLVERSFIRQIFQVIYKLKQHL